MEDRAWKQMDQKKSQSFLFEFLKLYLPLVTLVIIAALAIISYQKRLFRSRLSIREANAVQMEKRVVETMLGSLLSDAVFLSETAYHKLTASSYPESAYLNLAKDFRSFANTRWVYDQIRMLDTRGVERVRVNMTANGPVVIPGVQLQDKSTRPYFKKTMDLDCRLYLSRFDLNVEQGLIELPFKPMLRFAAPVYNEARQKIGLIVLNYLGVNLINHIDWASQSADGDFFLVNPEGYWLIGPDPDLEWGFMLPGAESNTIQDIYPSEWEQLSTGESGQFISRNGLFTYVTIISSSTLTGQILREIYTEEDWKLVSRIPPDKINPAWWTLSILLSLGLCLLLALITGQLSMVRVKRRQAIAALAESESLLRAVNNSAQDAIIVADEKGEITLWNPSAERMFGYSVEEARGRDVHELITPPVLVDSALQGFRRFIQNGKGTGFGAHREVIARKKNGQEFPVELSLAALPMENTWWAIGMVRDITERKAAEARLMELATTDGLTNVNNRRNFMELVEEEFRRYKRYQDPFCIMIFDVDHFKSVNDTYGHDVGDKVLVSLAETVGETVREVDAVGRLGGEEFGVLLPKTDLPGGRAFGERLRRAVEEIVIKTVETEVRITISVGVAEFVRGDTIGGLLKKADSALYAAKDLGRNRVEVFDSDRH